MIVTRGYGQFGGTFIFTVLETPFELEVDPNELDLDLTVDDLNLGIDADDLEIEITIDED